MDDDDILIVSDKETNILERNSTFFGNQLVGSDDQKGEIVDSSQAFNSSEVQNDKPSDFNRKLVDFNEI